MTKYCNRCEATKDLTEFYKSKFSSTGYYSECKACYKQRNKKYHSENWDEILKTKQKYAKNNRDRRRNNDYKRMYGISLDEYNEILHKQKGRCKICSSHHTELKGRRQHLVVDHCHTTGKVRGLLCDTCNRAIGMLKDCPDIILKAHEYLIQGLSQQAEKEAPSEKKPESKD